MDHGGRGRIRGVSAAQRPCPQTRNPCISTWRAWPVCDVGSAVARNIHQAIRELIRRELGYGRSFWSQGELRRVARQRVQRNTTLVQYRQRPLRPVLLLENTGPGARATHGQLHGRAALSRALHGYEVALLHKAWRASACRDGSIMIVIEGPVTSARHVLRGLRGLRG